MGKKKRKVVKPKKKFNPLWMVLTVVVVVVLMVMTFMKLDNANAAKVAEVGKQAPDFTLSTVDGKQVSLVQFRGKPVIINFWATWCPPCRAEMPALEEVSRQAASKGFVLLTVNQEEDAATVQSFLKQNKYDYPVVLDTNGAVSETYKVTGIPTSIFIDANGIIRDMHTGTMPDAQLFLNKVPR